MRKYKPPERLGRPPNCRWIYGVPSDPPDLWHSSSLENNRSFTNNPEVGLSNENYTVIRNCVSFPCREMTLPTDTFISNTHFTNTFDRT